MVCAADCLRAKTKDSSPVHESIRMENWLTNNAPNSERKKSLRLETAVEDGSKGSTFRMRRARSPKNY
jgi:hypothetical protein